MDLFNKYGTHVLTGVKMGGKIEIKSQYSSNDMQSLKEATAKLSMEVDGLFDGWLKQDKAKKAEASEEKVEKVDIPQEPKATDPAKATKAPTDKKENEKEFDYTFDYVDYKSSEEVLKTTYTTCYGGKGYDMTTFDKVKENYSKWIDEVGKSPAIIGVLGEESLYPIWNLVQCIADNDESLSDKEAAVRMKELEDAFNAYGLDNLDSPFPFPNEQHIYFLNIHTNLSG